MKLQLQPAIRIKTTEVKDKQQKPGEGTFDAPGVAELILSTFMTFMLVMKQLRLLAEVYEMFSEENTHIRRQKLCAHSDLPAPWPNIWLT